jgi:hypothetical protein
MTPPTADANAAELSRLIEQIGGIVSLMDLAREWDVSKTRVHQMSRHTDFPAPVAEVASGSQRALKLYSRAQAEAWRAVKRKPGPRPRASERQPPTLSSAQS